MATLFVTEYTRMGEDRQGADVQAPEVPPRGTQTVSIGASSAAVTNALNGPIVELHCDIPCHVAWDRDGSPTATTSDKRMEGGDTQTFVLEHSSRGTVKVAVIEA